MRIICLLTLFLFGFGATCAAVSPVTNDSVAAALEYGKNQAEKGLSDFFEPWTVYEESADKLTESTDRAFLYTPFLLLAADARDKTLNREVVDPADADRVLAEYNGYLVFGATLFGDDADFAGKATAVLKQGKKTIKAELFSEKTSVFADNPKVFVARCYIYFASRDVKLDKSAVLQIACDKHQKNKFFFDLAQFR